MGHELLLSLGLLAAASGPSGNPLAVRVTKAPVAPDGTTALAVTDFVLTFANPDPDIDGIGLPTGATVEIDLPADFINTGNGVNTAIVLQGWPQSPIAPFPYDLDVTGNHITLTLTSDYLPGSDGEGGPGPKQVHLLLNSFTNPAAGWYEIPLAIDLGNGTTYSGAGLVEILPAAEPNLNIVCFESGGGPPPPFNNAVYQTLALGEDALLTRLFVWDANSVPYLGVELRGTSNPKQYRLVHAGVVVGSAVIDPPAGAVGYKLTATGPSVDVPNPVTMVPTAGLDTQFLPDPVLLGDYEITFRLNHGNIQRQVIRVR